jgi:hypothetical protein
MENRDPCNRRGGSGEPVHPARPAHPRLAAVIGRPPRHRAAAEGDEPYGVMKVVE